MPPLGDERSIGELKDLVVQTLETNGVLGHIRAELRAHVYKAIEQEEQSNARGASKLLRMPEGRLMAELVREFFEFYGFKHSLSVFLPESSLGREGRSREAVGQDAGLARVEQGRSALEQILELAAGQEETRRGGLVSCGSSTAASTPPPSAMASRAQVAREQGPDPLQQVLKASPSMAPKAAFAPGAQAQFAPAVQASAAKEEPAAEAPAAAGGPGLSFQATRLAPLTSAIPAVLGDLRGGGAPSAPPTPEAGGVLEEACEEPDAEEPDASSPPPRSASGSPGSASGSQPGAGPQQASPTTSASPVASPAASNRSAGSQRSEASQASSHARSAARSSAASSQGSRSSPNDSSRGPSAPEQVQSFRSDSDRSRQGTPSGEVKSFRSDSEISRQRSPAGAASPAAPSNAGTPASRSGGSGGLLGAIGAASEDEESVSMEDSGEEDIELVGGADVRGGGASDGAYQLVGGGDARSGGGPQAAARGAPPAASRPAAVLEDVEELESIGEDFSVHSSIEGYPESEANQSNEEASGE